MSRKELLKKAAIELFAEKSYKSVSSAEIVARAQVAQGTLFYHFKNKQGILFKVLQDIMEEYLEYISGVAGNDDMSGLDKLMSLIEKSSSFRKNRSQELLVLMRDFPHESLDVHSSRNEWIAGNLQRILHLFENILDQGIKDGSIRGLDAQKTAHFLFGMLTGIDRHVMLSPVKAPNISEQVKDFCFRALAAVAD